MALLKSSSSLGDYVGKVGTVILTTWKSLCVMKSLHVTRRKTKVSEAELTQRQLFKLIMKLLSKTGIGSVIKLGYQEPKKPTMTPLNAASSYHLLNAVVGDAADPHLDLALMKFSKPIRPTQKIWRPILLPRVEKQITINWELNPYPQKCTQLDDRVILVLYDSEADAFQVAKTAIRSSLTYTFSLGPQMTGHKMFCYLFLVSADGKLVSETQYLGMTGGD
jgi:hypothetical protein